jgi:hypothetical protein
MVRYYKTKDVLSYHCKTSYRWYKCEELLQDYPLNYISPRGRDTGMQFATWHTDYRNVIMSRASTIFQRVVRYYRSRVEIIRSYCDELVAFATIYALCPNYHFFTRAIFLIFRYRNRKNVRGFLLDYLSSRDSNIRFVFCHAWKQAYWLSSRSKTLSSFVSLKKIHYPIFDLNKIQREAKVSKNRYAIDWVYYTQSKQPREIACLPDRGMFPSCYPFDTGSNHS